MTTASTRDGMLCVSLVEVVEDDAAGLAIELGRQGVKLLPTALGEVVRPVTLVWLPPAMTRSALVELTRRLQRSGARRLLAAAPSGDAIDRERAVAAGFDDAVAGKL